MTACAAKFFHELNLLVGEGPNFLAGQGERADQIVFLQHRDYEGCPRAAKVNGRNFAGLPSA